MEIRRPLKRVIPKLGPPDIYPQDPKQKEDELTSVNVKQGYTSAPLVSGPNGLDEFGSAKNADIQAFGVFFSALLSEKHRIDTLKDTQKKKQLVNTKEIWYVHAKTKHAVDNWFRDLANGTKSLGQLGKRIPIFNSKEGMFSQLYESHVPLAKAVWFIKMSAVHAIALSESSSKSKKRQVPDQYQELTSALTKYLKDIAQRMFENHQAKQQQQPPNQPQQQNLLSHLQQPSTPQSLQSQSQLFQQPLQQQFQQQTPQSIMSQWQYQTQLARYLFDEGLLDQYDFLCFLLELIEKKRQISELFVKVICPLILEYVIDFSGSAVLSRRLAHVCARKLCQALHHHPMTANNWISRRAEMVPHLRLAMSNSNSLSLGSDSLLAKEQAVNSSARGYKFDSRILDTQSYFLTRNSSPTTNNTHLTANSILDIVKAQIIESQSIFPEKNSSTSGSNSEQDNSESNLYKDSIYILSSILQVICVECPTAMVRHHIVDAKFPPMFQGSPLDHLPHLPSSLPMLDSDLNFELRRSIHDAEREILQRSAMADSKWSCQSANKTGTSKANLVNKLLTVIDTLDKHYFDRIDSNNSIDILYSKIFLSNDSSASNKVLNAQVGQLGGESQNNRSSNNLNALETSTTQSLQSNTTTEHSRKSKHQQIPPSTTSLINSSLDAAIEVNGNKNIFEEHVTKLLCEWATTTQRTGEHRALIVARLLEKRQAELQSAHNELLKECNLFQKAKRTDDLKSGNLNNTPADSSNSPKTRSEEQTQAESDSDQEEIIQHTFQNLLVQFLDENAPIIEEGQSDNIENKKAFDNLVLLFSQLIRCDVFSHYNYMCTLISRGMFNDLSRETTGATDSASIDSPAPNSNLNQPNSVKPPRSVGKESDSMLSNTILGSAGNMFPLSVSSNSNKQTNHLDSLSGSMGFSPDSSQPIAPQNLFKSGFDHHSDDVDVDISLIAQRVNERDQDEDNDFKSPDYVGGSSPGEDSNTKPTQLNKLSLFDDRSVSLENPSQSSGNIMQTNAFPPTPVDSKSIGISSSANETKASTTPPSELRHGTFVRHFPVPDDEYYSRDINQRMILLYGFGKERDEARHSMRKLSKEITRIIRKAARDFNDGGKLTKFAQKEGHNFDSALGKFEKLNHYDQHEITNDLADLITEIFTVELAKLGKDEGDIYQGSKKVPCLLPTLESVSFAFTLFAMAANVSGLLELIVLLLEKLSDVKLKAKDKNDRLASEYIHSIALCSIGMLYRYHSCVLLLPENDLCSIFKSLQKLVNDIPSLSDCRNSMERVIFVYLHDLCSQAGLVLDNNNVNKFKQLPQAPGKPDGVSMRQDYTPILTNIVESALCNSANMVGLMPNVRPPNTPLSSADISIIREKLFEDDCRRISDTTNRRYSFVCDAIYHSATSKSYDFVNELAVLCADVTTRCPAFMNDWVQVLQDLCSPAQRENYIHNHQGFSRSIFDKIDISSPLVMDNIAIFTAILVARRCLELSSFIRNALTIILGVEQQQQQEAGIRLTCHLTLTLYRNTEYQSNQPRGANFAPTNPNLPFGVQGYDSNVNQNFSSGILGGSVQPNLFYSLNVDSGTFSKLPLQLKYLCDHHLLRSACFNIKTEFHLLLLKAIRYLASFTSPGSDADLTGGLKADNHFDDMNTDSSSMMHRNLDSREGSGLIHTNFNTKHINLQTASLHQFADAVLKLLCSQRWLHDKCLSDSDLLASRNPLFDPRLDVKQSQGLLYMICYNKSPERQADVGLDDQGSDQVASIVKMFENLDVWSMRLSLVRLQFMYAYCKSQSSVNDWLDNLAKAVVEFFQKTSQENEQEKDTEQSKPNKCITNINKVWLVEPLLDKLDKPPSSIPSKIIRASAALMESASVRANSLPSLNQTYLSTAAASTKFKERTLLQRGSASTNPSNLASTSLLGFQPFISLLLSCLKNQDKERDTLLTSLNSQLYQAIHEKVDDMGYKQSIQDGLELRLCLIGQMFDTIQRSANLTSDWATLLLLLIMNNLVDPQVDYKLYVSVLDMLATLIHSAYASDPIEQKEEAKKQYQNLMKKFRKELAALEEKGFIQMKLINPLMPLVRQMTEVITCEPMGSLVDTKGEKVENFYSIDSKKGLKVSEVQEVSPWDLIEGHKNPAPLSWPWFGALRLEHKPLRAEENNRLMSWHTHTIRHSTNYFCQGPNTDDGPSSAKRSNSEKKPSQSNPLLKSLIEANDESSTLLNKRDTDTSNKCHEDDSSFGDFDDDQNYIGRDDLLEDYCELPVCSLFDSTPVEVMIDDIKTAMQAEQAALSSRHVKAPLPPIDVRPILSTPQASSILAPVQPELNRSTTPHLSALSALQNHLNASGSNESSSLLAGPGPGSVQSITMSPIVNPNTPEIIPARTPSSMRIAPTPPPVISTNARSMSPMVVGRSPAVAQVNTPIAPVPIAPTPTPPKPKTQRKKRVTKKDTAANVNMIDAKQNLNKSTTPMNIVGSNVAPYGNTMDTMNHGSSPMVVTPSKMVQNPQPNSIHQVQAGPGNLVRRGPIPPQQGQQPQQHQMQQQQHMQQQSNVYDFPYQPSQPTHQNNQFVINSYYDQQTPQSNQMFNQNQQQPPQTQPQMPIQMNIQNQHQHQHHQPRPQHHMQPGQHIQQPHQQHPQIHYMPAQQIRVPGHQHQQPMSFPQIQTHQHPTQQIFTPQQAAGHSRPAISAMLQQKQQQQHRDARFM